jgi:sugar O-acyltransferase (sialic acid O-acetyltransferase NeuD family)
MKKIAIFGAGGMGREAQWLIEDINRENKEWEFIGYFDDDFSNAKNIDPVFFLGGTEALNNFSELLHIVIAIGSPSTKKKIAGKISNPFIKYPVLIHPHVPIPGRNVQIGEGTMICAGCIVTVDINIGKHVLLNVGTIVCHDSRLGDFVSIMPSVNISGEVEIGEGTYLGTGTKVIQQISIGSNTIVGAGAVVTNSLPSNCTAVGIPANPIRFHGS